MHKTPKHIFEEIVKERPECERQVCFKDHVCDGRSTMEHALIYRGRQIPDKWAVIRLCYWSHLGPGLDKRKNEYLALRHATPEDLAEYPKKDWSTLQNYLNKKYGSN